MPEKNDWEMKAGRWVEGALEAWGTHCTRPGATGQISRSGASKYSAHIPVAQSEAQPCRSISLYIIALASEAFGDLGMTVSRTNPAGRHWRLFGELPRL